MGMGRPLAAGAAGGAAAGAATGAVVASQVPGKGNGTSPTGNPCQTVKDGVPMYNFGAPGCDP